MTSAKVARPFHANNELTVHPARAKKQYVEGLDAPLARQGDQDGPSSHWIVRGLGARVAGRWVNEVDLGVHFDLDCCPGAS